MKGDFSRGFNPDSKRGQIYRRVLLQQGRLLLDSDYNTGVDALDALIRALGHDLGCHAGSPDLGFLVTPGRLLALFDPIAGIEPATTGGVEVLHDYSRKYLDRYPSLRVTASGGAGTVTIPFRNALTGAVEIDFWVRADVAVPAPVTGAGNLSVPLATEFTARSVTLTDASEVEITLAADEEIWIGLIETRRDATRTPFFGVTAGRYYLEGLKVENPADEDWPEVGFGADVGFLVEDFELDDGGPRNLLAGDRIVAYLEGYERHLTRVEDLGIFEQALGSGPDTCTRSEAVGQVKLAFAPGISADDTIAAAEAAAVFGRRDRGDGTLVVDAPPVLEDPDPCALPVAGGYTGRDHRLYRFEVHVGGDLSTLVMKWSRDNGSELFAVQELSANEVAFAPDVPLRAGDLVEILSETIDLGDAENAVLDIATGAFVAPESAVGDLVRLEAMAAAGANEVRFRLVDRATGAALPAPGVDTARYGDPTLSKIKVRRWHGSIEPAGAPAPFAADLEDGLQITLQGTYEVGDWWQYEARVGRDNANGPWQDSPHGPERLFAPLALLEFTAQTDPLRLIAWLDERFPAICSLDADDIAFDGDRIGSDSDTVQEVIEELYEREAGGGCCDVTLEPDDGGGDDAQRVRDALAELPADRGVTICLRPGIYRFATPFAVDGRRIEIRGCPDALVTGTSDGMTLVSVGTGGRLKLADLTLFLPAALESRDLVQVQADAQSFEAERVAFVNANANAASAAIRLLGGTARLDVIRDDAVLDLPPAAPGDLPDLELIDCVTTSAQGITGNRTDSCRLHDTLVHCAGPGISLVSIRAMDLVRCALRTGLDLGAAAGGLPSLTAEQMFLDGESILEALAPNLPALGGAEPAVAVELIVAGTIRRCLLTGDRGVMASSGSFFTLEDNNIAAGSVGISLKQAISVNISGHRFLVANGDLSTTIHVPLYALGLRITECDMAGSAFGVILAAPLAGTADSPFAFLLAVSIAGNTFSTGDTAVQVGPRLGEYINGAIGAAEIRGNQIQSAQTGLLLRGQAETGVSGAQIRISENVIIARQGLAASGPQMEIEGNEFYPANLTRLSVAILSSDARNMVIESNLIRIFESVDGERVAAIDLANAIGARIADNAVYADRDVIGITVDTLTRGQITGNYLQRASLRVNGGLAPVVKDNHVERTLYMDRCIDGTVHGNKVGMFGSTPLTIWRAEGAWQVNDNRVDGAIFVAPVLNLITVGGIDIGTDIITAEDRLRDTRTTEAMRVLAGAAPATGPDGDTDGMFLTRDTSPAEAGFVLMALEDPVNAVTEAVLSEIAEAWEAVFADDLAVTMPPFLPLGWIEQQINAQVNDNVGTGLTVGASFLRAPLDSEPAFNSVVQAVGNSIRGNLYVRQYRRRNVSNNVAVTYSGGINSSTGPITVHNLRQS
jgi:hypothetical protein